MEESVGELMRKTDFFLKTNSVLRRVVCHSFVGGNTLLHYSAWKVFLYFSVFSMYLYVVMYYSLFI